MRIHIKDMIAGCVALLSGIAFAHFPIGVSPESDDGLARGGWSGLQIGLVNYIEGGWILPLVNWRF